VIQEIDTSAIRAYIDLEDCDEPGVCEERIQVDAPDGLRTAKADPEFVEVEVDTVVSREFEVDILTPDIQQRNLNITNTTVTPDRVTVTGVAQNVDRVERVIVEAVVDDQTSTFTTEVTPIAVDGDAEPIAPVTVEPAQVTLTVSLEIRGKEVPIYVQCECDAAENFEVIGQPLANPNTVLVDGPRELLDEVNFVYTTPINTSDLTEPTVIGDVPLDVSKLPEGIDLERDFVDVSVRVEQATFAESFENIPIQIFGEQENTRVSVSPETLSVELQGPQQVVGALTDEEIAVVVDVSGLGPGTHQVRPRLILPPQVSYSDPPPQVIVTIVAIPATPTPSPTATPEPEPPPEATTPP
jgi:YbbR domain-containing protein